MKPDFSKYTGLIRENLQHTRKSKLFSKALPLGAIGAIREAKSSVPQQKLTLSDPVMDNEFFLSLHALTGVAGKAPKYHQAPGLHPDFATIKHTGNLEYHWIVSMFIDVQRSTKLFAKYEPFAVANIITAIQRAAIHIAWYFDSYVQRYHGDGLLLYFGGKGMDRKKAIENAILTASVFTKFVKEELPGIFLEQGIEDIYTRIGIDVGEDEDTLWHLAGMQACSEVTTCSLHTSLAAHMQGAAKRNGIMVGHNVKEWSGLDAGLFNIMVDGNGKEDRYCFIDRDENFYYTQWNFKWEDHLQNLEGRIPPAVVAGPAILSRPTPAPERNMNYLRQQASQIRPYCE